MSLLQGYFAPQYVTAYSLADGASALAKWTVTFPSIATASCERKVASSSAVKDFYAHFNPVCACGLSYLDACLFSVFNCSATW
jgi:hypothetical protein